MLNLWQASEGFSTFSYFHNLAKEFLVQMLITADTSIDLHLHTTYSDGLWSAEQLVDYLTKKKTLIHFKKYKKVARTLARLLTPQDYEERQGVVYAPEGRLKFTPGDYLAKDAKGEWTIWQVTMRDKYVKVASEDEDGFVQYWHTDASFSAQKKILR
jgi:hypothetical protein